jgi:predicted membrane channel-forming protein YqfA (hemolysin III family)
VVGATAFSVTAMLLYFASTMYHALPAGRAKRVLNVLDHSAIYLFIAGSGLAYTAGAVVFTFDSKLRYAHFVWHLFVLAGSTCHFFAALDYAS